MCLNINALRVSTSVLFIKKVFTGPVFSHKAAVVLLRQFMQNSTTNQPQNKETDNRSFQDGKNCIKEACTTYKRQLYIKFKCS